jgi:hypothetical protein
MGAVTRTSVFLVALLAYGCSSSKSDEPTEEEQAGGSAGDVVTNTGGDTGQTTGGGGNPGTDASVGTGGQGGSGQTLPVPDGGLIYGETVSPVPPADWVNVTNNLAGMASECGNAAAIFASPWRDMLVTGVARHGLYASADGGATWVSLGKSGGSAIRNRMTVILFDPVSHDTFWESGIYGWETVWSEGVFITKDNGNSFKGLPNMGPKMQSHNDSISVDFTDPARKAMLSGGHEQGVAGGEGLFLCKDGSGTFAEIMPKLPAGLGFCTSTLVVDAMTMLVGCANSYKGETPGIVRSADAGATWKIVSTQGGSGQPVLAKDGTIYWAAAGGGMLKSTDQGQTFMQVADKSKTGGIAPFELPDGRIVSVGGNAVVVSADKGVTWTAATKAIPFTPNGLSYSAFRRAFYASHFDCSNNVPANAHARFGWDHTAN